MTLRTLLLGIIFTLFTITQAAAATYTVDRLDDVTATACTAAANDCSLRGAIANANANGVGADTINFNVGGGNFQTINITLEMPAITSSLTIDGTTQPLWGGPPIVEINGLGAAAANTDGFNIASPVTGESITVTIKSLVINRFNGNGIYSHCSSGCTVNILGSYIGTNGGGSLDFGNGASGIKIDDYPSTTIAIGGTGTNERNVISGNDGDGVYIVSALGFQNANSTVLLQNNFIGTSAGGSSDVGNTGSGVNFGGLGFDYSLQVGNGLANGRNIISGNDQHGIAATSGAVTIVGNYVGLSIAGNIDLGNTLDGIHLDSDVVSATIGGTVIGIPVGNVISGNNQNGIWIGDASVPATIRGNKIGTNPAGTAAFGNSADGIALYESTAATTSSIVIGSDTDAGDGNTISANGTDGVSISELVRGVKLYANRIGTNDAATAKLANGVLGVRIMSSQNEIGKADNSIAANVISGNTSIGIMMVGVDAGSNVVYGNYIGTNSSGSNLGNGTDGIYFNQSAHDNIIGNGMAGGSNTIAFNSGKGVNVSDGINNSIRVNSIYSNGALGIDLNSDGVTSNDNNDTDTGPNALQNYPIIINASPSQVYGNLNSIPNAHFTIDLYRVDSCDASGNGEGRYYLGSKNITVTNSGTSVFNYLDVPLSVGQIITATATDDNGNTSEFSPCYTANPAPGTFSFTSAAYTANESSTARTIVVSRSGGSFGTAQVNYATTGGTATAGVDYGAQSGTLVFLNGEVVKSFDIPITNDLLDEVDETINLSLSFPTNGSYLTAPNTSVLTIIDDDAPPTINIGDVSTVEGNLGNTQFNFTVGLSAPSSLPITVDYTTVNGTATASSDFVGASGQVTFQPGENLKTIPITVLGDLVPELNETFTVDLSNATNATFADNQGLGTIVDDDNPGKFSFAFAPYSGTEHGLVTATVTRTNGSAGTVSVDYTTTGGTATPGTDYFATSGTLIFGDGETTKTFTVALADDTIPEPTETVDLVLSNPIGGASLGAPSTAVLTIFDDDNGSLLSIAGVVRKTDSTPIAGVTMTLQGAQNATTQTDTSGRYSFANIAPNSTYTVTPSALGYTFAPISQTLTNITFDQLNVNFVGTSAPSRQIRVVGGNATPGQNIQATVELVAQGDENSVGFSLSYDPTILNSPTVALNPDASTANLFINTSQTGKLGVLLSLPANQAFPVGTRSLVTVTFATSATNQYSSPLTFGDTPIAREVANFNADPLPTTYLDGSVTFAQGYEGDLAPRPTGNNNGTVTVADVTQVGRFVAGLDTLNPAFNEFQRADTAPRVTLGNASLTVADYTQAGRYAAGIDVVNPAGGAAAASFAAIDESKGILRPGAATVVRVVNNTANPGQQVLMTVEADAQGTENGFGFTLIYDSSKLSNPLVSKGADTQTATLIPNTAQSGRVGVVLAMPFGTGLTGGTKQLVTVRFDVSPSATGGSTPLTFADTPVQREVSDVDANVLTSNFASGSLQILAPTAAEVPISGRVVTNDGRPIGGVEVSVTNSAGGMSVAISNAFGYFRFDSIAVGESYVVSASSKRYVFTSQLITVTVAIGDIEFVGQPTE